MKTQTLTIQIPTGHEVESFDPKSGMIKFKEIPKSVLDRIKTVDDIFNENGITPEKFYAHAMGSDDEVAYSILKMLAASLNEGWVPDWNNTNEWKYYPWFEMGGSSGFRFVDCDDRRSISDVGSRLCFKSSELAKYAGKQFADVYKRFMLI